MADLYLQYGCICLGYVIAALAPFLKELMDMELDDRQWQSFGKYLHPWRPSLWATWLIVHSLGLFFALNLIPVTSFVGMKIYFWLGNFGIAGTILLAGGVAFLYNHFFGRHLIWFALKRQALREKRRERPRRQ